MIHRELFIKTEGIDHSKKNCTFYATTEQNYKQSNNYIEGFSIDAECL